MIPASLHGYKVGGFVLFGSVPLLLPAAVFPDASHGQTDFSGAVFLVQLFKARVFHG